MIVSDRLKRYGLIEKGVGKTLWTIGHSTRPIEEFLELLAAYRIVSLVDVRLIPYSRRHPQFHTDRLAKTLADAHVQYHHLPTLGGRRKARPDSLNQGWRNANFRGYADYMQTGPFLDGLEQLIRIADAARTAVMCAEAVPWRCHRSLIADALVSRGWEVRHITSRMRAAPHRLTAFATLVNGTLVYPPIKQGQQTDLLE